MADFLLIDRVNALEERIVKLEKLLADKANKKPREKINPYDLSQTAKITNKKS